MSLAKIVLIPVAFVDVGPVVDIVDIAHGISALTAYDTVLFVQKNIYF